MLPVSMRLTDGRVKDLSSGGRRYGYPECIVLYLSNECGYMRAAVRISARTAKHAVDRNRIKRLIRESIRHLNTASPASADMLIIVRRNIAGYSLTEMGQLMARIRSQLPAAVSDVHT